MKIIKYKKLKENLYRVFLEDDSFLDIYENVILENNLLYKKEIDKDLLDKIKNENNYQTIYNMCVKYIMVRLRSIYEMRVYLSKKNYDNNLIDTLIDKLIKNKLLDDNIFTNAYIKDKLNFTNYGKYKIINELKLKYKIDNDIIYLSINAIEDDLWNKRIDKLINKYINSNKKYSGNILKNKLYTYLINLGYDKDIVIQGINNYDF